MINGYSVLGFHFRDITFVMEKQMEQTLEHKIETGVLWESRGIVWTTYCPRFLGVLIVA